MCAWRQPWQWQPPPAPGGRPAAPRPRGPTAMAAAHADRRLGAVAQGVNSAEGVGAQENDEDTTLHWVVGEPVPAGLQRCDPFLSSLVPRPTAWVSVPGACGAGANAVTAPMVCLLDGYNASSDRPPTIMFAAAALPTKIFEQLRQTAVCCLSVATPRDFSSLDALAQQGTSSGGRGEPSTFEALGLEPAPRVGGRPPAVASSPCQLDCRLLQLVELGRGQAMVLLLVEDFTISGSVLVRQTAAQGQDSTTLPNSNPDVRQIAAKLEAALVQPLAALGPGRFGHVGGPGAEVCHMLRPKQAEPGAAWTGDTFKPAAATVGACGDFEDVKYCYAKEEQCSLGYNPMKQICQPVSLIERFSPFFQIWPVTVVVL
jgi:flavin reductase (DIM6/NTAB) family NADH-FMN oxidoreductase RutF